LDLFYLSGSDAPHRIIREPSIVTPDPETMNVTRCVRGTRAPFQTLPDYLEGGETLNEFLEQFPIVKILPCPTCSDSSPANLPGPVTECYALQHMCSR